MGSWHFTHWLWIVSFGRITWCWEPTAHVTWVLVIFVKIPPPYWAAREYPRQRFLWGAGRDVGSFLFQEEGFCLWCLNPNVWGDSQFLVCIIYGIIILSKGLSFLKTCMRIPSHLQRAYNLDNPEGGKKAQKHLVFKMSRSRLWFLGSLTSAVARAERTGPGAEAPRTCPRLGAGRGRKGRFACWRGEQGIAGSLGSAGYWCFA